MLNNYAVLLLSCPDKVGLVSSITNFISDNNGNIVDLDEHVATSEKMFFIRVVWDLTEFRIPISDLDSEFGNFLTEIDAKFEIKLLNEKSRTAIFVSKYDHCLFEILWRNRIGEYPFEISLIISNHKDLREVAAMYEIPFYYFPINNENKLDQEQKEIELLKKNNIDTIVLARYMQILSADFVSEFPNQIINIHHSFLPAFVGSNPYKQAYERGVKIIGATSHYVTEILDDGPIIEQDIIKISHKESLSDLIRKGRDLERLVLARALINHVEHRILVSGRKTIVFE